MNRLVTVHGFNCYGRPSRVTLKFDDNKKLLNPGNVARSSMVGWGRWQASEKIPCKYGSTWWVSTSGHGGYILVCQEDYDGIFPMLSLDVEEEMGKCRVYEFEEDCNWAILEYHDELVRSYRLSQVNETRKSRGEDPFSDEEYLKLRVIPCLERWNPEVIHAN